MNAKSFRHFVVLAAALLPGCYALGQSSDALLNKLVEKGILTTTEAKELKQESDKNFTTAYAAKSGMPEWVRALKFGGDFRGRFDSINPASDDAVDRNRWRYRLRFGATAILKEDFEVGLRLASGDLDSGISSGVSGLGSNQSFQNNASKKGILVDQAFARWTPLNAPDTKGILEFGKMENPFVFAEVGPGMGLGMDPDYTPEGAALRLEHRLDTTHTLRGIAGGFVLDEIANAEADPFLFGAQARWDAAWTKRFSTSLGALWLGFANVEKLANAAVPNANVGNSRVVPPGTNDAGAVPLYGFSPWLLDASATYRFDSGPLYPGPFPIKLTAAWLHNPDAPDQADNTGWSAGVLLGRAGKRGTWELGTCYKFLGANSIWEEVVDDDFGGYWATTAGTGFDTRNAPGYFTGTNVRGWVTKLSYSPTDALTLNVKWYRTELIDAPTPPPGADGESCVNRFQVDAVLRF